MLKFEYHYLTNSLFTQIPGESSQSIPQGFANEYGGKGFILEPVNHWITFTTYPNLIRAFYKEVQEEAEPEAWPQNLAWKDWVVSADTLVPTNQTITYYQKDLPKISPVSFTFTTQDQVHKIDGQWVKK